MEKRYIIHGKVEYSIWEKFCCVFNAFSINKAHGKVGNLKAENRNMTVIL